MFMNIKKYKELIVEHWIPVSITGILAIVGGIIFSSVDADISDNRFFLEKQANTAERVTLAFSKYAENIRRIDEFKIFVESNNKAPSLEQIYQLKKYITVRTLARDELFSSLDNVSLYFDEDTSGAAYEFRQWDEIQSKKTSSKLPSASEWQSKQKAILLLMREELVK